MLVQVVVAGGVVGDRGVGSGSVGTQEQETQV